MLLVELRNISTSTAEGVVLDTGVPLGSGVDETKHTERMS